MLAVLASTVLHFGSINIMKASLLFTIFFFKITGNESKSRKGMKTNPLVENFIIQLVPQLSNYQNKIKHLFFIYELIKKKKGVIES